MYLNNFKLLDFSEKSHKEFHTYRGERQHKMGWRT